MQNEDLATEFGVTVMTIHRDLNVLEAQGWLHKVRGGATVDTSALVDTTVRHRLTDKVAEKRAIARCAMQYVDDAEVVMIDDSTTALEVARLFPGRGHLTVITNFLMAINSLTEASDIDTAVGHPSHERCHLVRKGADSLWPIGRLGAGPPLIRAVGSVLGAPQSSSCPSGRRRPLTSTHWLSSLPAALRHRSISLGRFR